MTRIFAVVFALLFIFESNAQKDSIINSLKSNFDKSTNIADKVDLAKQLAEYYNLEKPNECKAILEKAILLAEESRDRKLMARSRRYAANVFSSFVSIKEYAKLASDYATQALEICKKENNLNEEFILCKIEMARIQRGLSNYAEAKKYGEAALNDANDFDNDSLKVVTRLGLSYTQLAMKDKLEAFRSIFSAQAAVDATPKNKTYRVYLEALVNDGFARFYASIEDYDKAIDYTYKYAEYAKKESKKQEYLSTISSIGNLYFYAKKYTEAKNIYFKLQQIADSLKDSESKISGQLGVVNVLLESPEKQEGFKYFRENPQIAEMFKRYGMESQLDFGYGNVFSYLKQYDSADYYYNKSIPILEKLNSPKTLAGYYLQFSVHNFKKGSYLNSITYLNKVKSIYDTLKLSTADYATCYEYLDSCYRQLNDYKNAFFYNNLAQKARKEIDEKNKSKDILNIQIDAENKRRDKMLAAEKIETNKRHNLQYTGIVVGILTLFIGLIMLGFFKMPIKWIRVLGFISFIFLFEFIIFILDTAIHKFTHGEPLYVVLIKVAIIAVLLPLHHYLEHKVIKYVINKHHQETA